MKRIILAMAVVLSYGQALVGRAQATGGNIRGHVVLRGEAPGNPIIRMGVDPKCGQLNSGKRVLQESALVAADGSVANVFVRLEGKFAPTPVPADAVVIDQRACVYGPRVVGVRVGQTLRVLNSDDLLHNVHSSSAVGNSFNIGQPKSGMSSDFTPKAEEFMLKLGCDVHRWMTAYVGVVSHPYFAVSDARGSFEIAKVPPGTYTLRVWHERFGESVKSVTVKPGLVTTIDLQYPATTSK